MFFYFLLPFLYRDVMAYITTFIVFLYILFFTIILSSSSHKEQEEQNDPLTSWN